MVVLSHGLHAAAEVDPRRADGTPRQRIERARTALGERKEIPLRSLVEPAEQGQDLVADQPALRLRVGRVGAEREPDGLAVRLRLVAPDAEQRADDAVLALGLDPAGLPARHQPVDDGLDLVGCRVAGGAQPVGRERVAERRAARPRSRPAEPPRPRPRGARRRTSRPRPTRRRADHGSRAARRPRTRARAASATARRSPRRRRRGTSPRRRPGSGRAAGSAPRRARGSPSPYCGRRCSR